MNVFKFHIYVIISVCIAPTIVMSQDVDEIIARHIKAHGDIEKWESIKNMEITGKFTAFSVEKDFYTIKTSKGEYYSDVYIGQHKVMEAFDGSAGWTIDPWHDFTFPRELNKSEVNVFYQKAEFFTPFFRYKERGFSVELLDNQNVDGMDMIVIKLTRPNDKVETWFLDAETYLEYKCESEWVDFAYGVPAESYFDDFRNIEGLVIPFFVERTYWQRDRITRIEDINFNIDVDPDLFVIPRSEEIEILAFMVGEWNVKVEMMSRRGGWYKVDSTTSTIAFEANNLLIEKINYDMTYVQSKNVRYTYNGDAEKYIISLYNGFSSDIELFEGGFNDTAFVALNINLDCNDSIQPNNYTQIIMSEMKEDGFIVQINSSADEGANWRPRQKLTYSRKN